jgi:hypothetical protein
MCQRVLSRQDSSSSSYATIRWCSEGVTNPHLLGVGQPKGTFLRLSNGALGMVSGHKRRRPIMSVQGRVRTLNSQRTTETPQSAETGHKLPVVSHDLNGCFRPASLMQSEAGRWSAAKPGRIERQVSQS